MVRYRTIDGRTVSDNPTKLLKVEGVLPNRAAKQVEKPHGRFGQHIRLAQAGQRQV